MFPDLSNLAFCAARMQFLRSVSILQYAPRNRRRMRRVPAGSVGLSLPLAMATVPVCQRPVSRQSGKIASSANRCRLHGSVARAPSFGRSEVLRFSHLSTLQLPPAGRLASGGAQNKPLQEQAVPGVFLVPRCVRDPARRSGQHPRWSTDGEQ